MTDTVRDAKLVQYLSEAYAKEKELETSLEAHIGMTTRRPLKKRLQDHLKETKRHGRELERRIKKVGGGGPQLAGKVVGQVTGQVKSLAKGPLHAVRGTGDAEKMLKNAKTEYHNEFEEIATYTGIEALAEAVNDKETAKLARGIRREEERMAKFLEKQIPQLAKAVAKEEIPAAERRNGRPRSSSKRSSSSRSRGSSNGSSRSTTGSRKSSSRASSSRSGASAKRSASSSSRSSTAKRSGSTAKRSSSTSSRSRSSSKARSK